LIPLDLSRPDVEEASERDIESLRSVLESYKTTSCPQGDVTKLAEDVLRKLRATNSDHRYLHSIECDDVQRGDYLGKGSFASVFKCEFLGVKAAAKVFRTPSSTTPSSTWVAAVQREAELQARLRHPNVVQFIGYAASEKEHIIVSELMSKNLRNYLDENILEGQTRPPLSLLLAVDIMLQIGEGMKYLHQSGMMHRDLKATNILINVVERKHLCNSPSVQVKLTDFGFSKLKEATNSAMFTSKEIGATLWRAPEVFKQNTEKYTKAADVYSYAMVFFEVLTGKIPWCDAQGKPTRRMSDVLPSIFRGERPPLPPDCPARLSEFISKCWATTAEDRPKFPEVCEFLWQCKGQILTCSYAYPSPQSSTPQKCTNDGG
jgi:serine/threonine protein kinase